MRRQGVYCVAEAVQAVVVVAQASTICKWHLALTCMFKRAVATCVDASQIKNNAELDNTSRVRCETNFDALGLLCSSSDAH